MNGFNLFYQTCTILGNTPIVKNLTRELGTGTYKALGTLSNLNFKIMFMQKIRDVKLYRGNVLCIAVEDQYVGNNELCIYG